VLGSEFSWSLKMIPKTFNTGWQLVMVVCLLSGCGQPASQPESDTLSGITAAKSVGKPRSARCGVSHPIVASAQSQVGKTTI